MGQDRDDGRDDAGAATPPAGSGPASSAAAPAPGPLDAAFAAGLAAIVGQVPTLQRDLALALYTLLVDAMTTQGTPGYATVRLETLMAHVGRARGTVREALAVLAAAGVIARPQGARYTLLGIRSARALEWPVPAPADWERPVLLRVRDPFGDHSLGGDILLAFLRGHGFDEAEALTLAQLDAPFLNALITDPAWAADIADPAASLRGWFDRHHPGWPDAARILAERLARPRPRGRGGAWLSQQVAGGVSAPPPRARAGGGVEVLPPADVEILVTRDALIDQLRGLAFPDEEIDEILALAPGLVAAWLAQPDWRGATSDPRDFLWARVADDTWPTPRPR